MFALSVCATVKGGGRERDNILHMLQGRRREGRRDHLEKKSSTKSRERKWWQKEGEAKVALNLSLCLVPSLCVCRDSFCLLLLECEGENKSGGRRGGHKVKKWALQKWAVGVFFSF